MERKFLKDLGLESEIIDKILDQHSTDIGRHKTAADAAQSKVQQLEQDLAKRDTDITALKSVDAADLQSKLDALQAQYDAEVQSRTQQETARTYEDRRGTVRICFHGAGTVRGAGDANSAAHHRHQGAVCHCPLTFSLLVQVYHKMFKLVLKRSNPF